MSKIALTKDMYDQAKKEHVSLSQLLERLDPTTGESKLTAFERQLKEHNIVTQSIAAKGIYASNVEAFYRTEESRVLFPEFVATTLRESLMAESILPYLIALTTPIDSNAYRTIYCKTTAANTKAAKRKRVTEAAELPKSKLVTAEQTTNIYKYGNAIEASYEVIRRMRLDLLQLHVRRIGQQAAHDEVLDILDIIKDGDGNDNAATVYKNMTLDTSATTHVLSQNAFISFLLKFFPYKCNTIVANEAGLLQVLNILFPAATASHMIALLIGGMALPARVQMPQGLFSEFVLLYEPQVETVNGHAAIYGLDKRYAIEKVIETGSDISEAAAFISNQTQLLTISENSGFDKVLAEASAILEID
jgi:hypothetical protein